MASIIDRLKKSGAMLALSPLIIVGSLFTIARYTVATITNPRKALNIAYMVDQTSNVDTNGLIDETISARAAKARNGGKRWGCILCKVLDFVQSNHCTNALKNDIHNPEKNV